MRPSTLWLGCRRLKEKMAKNDGKNVKNKHFRYY